mmetsp:Transcript_37100/g.98673  ORF Transcript_37100/g.98673 Transcript_37100/m.98673 type:complete len:265 (+) Transcript_37100:330-1124(+)
MHIPVLPGLLAALQHQPAGHRAHDHCGHGPQRRGRQGTGVLQLLRLHAAAGLEHERVGLLLQAIQLARKLARAQPPGLRQQILVGGVAARERDVGVPAGRDHLPLLPGLRQVPAQGPQRQEHVRGPIRRRRGDVPGELRRGVVAVQLQARGRGRRRPGVLRVDDGVPAHARRVAAAVLLLLHGDGRADAVRQGAADEDGRLARRGGRRWAASPAHTRLEESSPVYMCVARPLALCARGRMARSRPVVGLAVEGWKRSDQTGPCA